MGNPYWIYETMVEENQCISIRQINGNDKFYLFLGKFIEKYSERIYKISKPSKLYDGSMVCIIHLEGTGEVHFDGKNGY